MAKNYEIPIEMLETHNMKSLEGYKEDFGDNLDTEKMFYQTFLIQTDYICNKIVEGVATWDDYKEEKEARAFARSMLSASNS